MYEFDNPGILTEQDYYNSLNSPGKRHRILASANGPEIWSGWYSNSSDVIKTMGGQLPRELDENMVIEIFEQSNQFDEDDFFEGWTPAYNQEATWINLIKASYPAFA